MKVLALKSIKTETYHFFSAPTWKTSSWTYCGIPLSPTLKKNIKYEIIYINPCDPNIKLCKKCDKICIP